VVGFINSSGRRRNFYINKRQKRDTERKANRAGREWELREKKEFNEGNIRGSQGPTSIKEQRGMDRKEVKL